MNLEFKYIKDKGNLKDERIVLKAKKSLDIGYFFVLLSKKHPKGGVSSTVRETFWFPDKQINEGDLIVLYTKSGTDTSSKNKDGTFSHFFYWGLPNVIFNDESDKAVILEGSDYMII